MARIPRGAALSFLVLFLLIIPLASAHQPRLVMGWDIHNENTSLLVPEPDISKAYYGELAGQPDYYKLVLQNTTLVYIGITAPYIPGSRTDFSVLVYDYKDMSITHTITLDGTRFQWKPFYEEFGGDWYLQGPEARENLTAGTYYIKVSSPSNTGKYALAIGEEEAFPPNEIINTYLLLPVLKQQFFGKHVLFLSLEFLGIILAMGSFLAASLIVLTAERIRLKSAIHYYGKIRYLTWLGFLLTAASLLLVFIQSPFLILGMLRLGIFIILLLLFLYSNRKVGKTENNVPAGLKASMYLSIILWLAFLFLAIALI